MRLALTHRRLTVLMSMASLLAFAGGAGLEPLSAILAATGLTIALFWHPSPHLSEKLERVWLPLAILLVLRAVFHVFVIRDDVVIPVVDLLFLLLIAEALRTLDAYNDSRLYSLSFALLLASTAYRPGLLFGVAFTAYVTLATVALMVGHLRRQAEQHESGDIPIPRAFLLTTVGLSGVTLAFSALVFLTFPRMSQGWAGRGEPPATSIAGFANQVSLGSHGSRIFGNPQIVLRVEFPDGTPADFQNLHWRGRSYDRFDGVRWSRSRRIPPSLAPEAWYTRWGDEVVRQRIYAASLDARVLFALHPMVDVDTHSRIQPIVDNVGDFSYWGSGTPAYTAWSIASRPSPQILREAEVGFAPARQYYLRLPTLPQGIRALADSLLSDIPTRYDKALALVDWFQREFTYTMELPATPREATLEHFLLRRKAGHCEYFSTGMAILLRTQGIPTREVNGFLGGEWSEIGNYLAVTQNQAHAWVEVWFPEVGWVTFDPTPSGAGTGTAEIAWFWPGRFLFDAVQHRWNKWVLDYSIQTQFDFLDRAQRFLSRTNEPGENRPSDSNRSLPGGPIWWVAGILVLAGGGVRSLRKRVAHPPTTRLFLRLREAGRRAGVPPEALHSPFSLARHLEETNHPSSASARRVVDRYLEDRFSEKPLAEERLRGMKSALKRALESLRKTAVKQGRRSLRGRLYESK